MDMSNYFEGLAEDVRTRYIDKIACIGVDPYSLKKGSADVRAFPAVTNLDIVQYLVFEKSAYSREEFKAFKSLEAYKNYKLGYIKNIECHRVKDFCVIRSRVTHSQKLNLANTHTWVLCRPSGEIMCAHCNCVAGLGEVCSHVGATLFAVEDMVRRTYEGPSVTDTEAYWKLPSEFLDYNVVDGLNHITEVVIESDYFDEPSLSPPPGPSISGVSAHSASPLSARPRLLEVAAPVVLHPPGAPLPPGATVIPPELPGAAHLPTQPREVLPVPGAASSNLPSSQPSPQTSAPPVTPNAPNPQGSKDKKRMRVHGKQRDKVTEWMSHKSHIYVQDRDLRKEKHDQELRHAMEEHEERILLLRAQRKTEEQRQEFAREEHLLKMAKLRKELE